MTAESCDVMVVGAGFGGASCAALLAKRGLIIGLAQSVGQGGGRKPSVRAPIEGLFYAGCDAGGYGVGTQQATESGIKVAAAVAEHHNRR